MKTKDTPTIEPGKYHVVKVPEGWKVIFAVNEYTTRDIDGKNTFKHRQAAYRRRKRENDRVLENKKGE